MKNVRKITGCVIALTMTTMLTGCSNPFGDLIEGIKDKVFSKSESIEEIRDLKSVTDEEILDTIKKANIAFNEVYNAFDLNDSIEVDIPYIEGQGGSSTFFKTTAPYDKVISRVIKLSEYWTNPNVISEMVTEGGNGAFKLIKQNDSLYFNPFNPLPSKNYEYLKVLEKKVVGDKIEVVFEVSYLDSVHTHKIDFCLDGMKLKVINDANIEDDEKGEIEMVPEISYDNVATKVKELMEPFGNYSILVNDLSGEDVLSINNEKYRAASTIKIFVMIEAFNQIAEGNLSLSEKITLTKADMVGGSGILNQATEGSTYTIEELITLMMNKSDNTAANILINRLGMHNINNTIKELGCINTELNRKMMDMDAIDKGIDNYTSVEDLNLVLKMLYNGECISEDLDEKMLNIMKNNGVTTKIPGELPSHVQVAHKSGEMTGIENDAGIVFTDKGAYIICILTANANGSNNDQISAISKLSLNIYDEFIASKK